jgi:hypothetical protein
MMILFGIVLVLCTIYIIYYYIYLGPDNKDVLSKMTPLHKKVVVATADMTQQSILGSNGTTVMGFFKLNGGDRTSKYQNQYTPLMYVENNWFLEISPAPMGKEESAARLRVQTNDTGALKYEIIDLPAIPKQKWMFIAILREGRRFDVIFQNKIVASQRLLNYPVVISSPLSVGNKGLDGSVIHVIVNGTRLSPTEVERTRVSYVDTNTMVTEAKSIQMSFPAIKLFSECPPGLPCDPVTKPPQNNLVQWSTPYA